MVSSFWKTDIIYTINITKWELFNCLESNKGHRYAICYLAGFNQSTTFSLTLHCHHGDVSAPSPHLSLVVKLWKFLLSTRIDFKTISPNLIHIFSQEYLANSYHIYYPFPCDIKPFTANMLHLRMHWKLMQVLRQSWVTWSLIFLFLYCFLHSFYDNTVMNYSAFL